MLWDYYALYTLVQVMSLGTLCRPAVTALQRPPDGCKFIEINFHKHELGVHEVAAEQHRHTTA